MSVRKITTAYFSGVKLPFITTIMMVTNISRKRSPAPARISRSFSTGML